MTLQDILFSKDKGIFKSRIFPLCFGQVSVNFRIPNESKKWMSLLIKGQTQRYVWGTKELKKIKKSKKIRFHELNTLYTKRFTHLRVNFRQKRAHEYIFVFYVGDPSSFHQHIRYYFIRVSFKIKHISS